MSFPKGTGHLKCEHCISQPKKPNKNHQQNNNSNNNNNLQQQKTQTKKSKPNHKKGKRGWEGREWERENLPPRFPLNSAVRQNAPLPQPALNTHWISSILDHVQLVHTLLTSQQMYLAIAERRPTRATGLNIAGITLISSRPYTLCCFSLF